MRFQPYVILGESGDRVLVEICPATQEDLETTRKSPKWQTDWNTDYLADPTVEKYTVKSPEGELIALGAYQIRGRSAYVYILYMESAPHSNPTIKSREERKYYGIGELLIAFGIKYSIDHGCRGEVLFDAKTERLARHYEEDFQARQVVNPVSGGPKRFMLADMDAWELFSKFLVEEEPE